MNQSVCRYFIDIWEIGISLFVVQQLAIGYVKVRVSRSFLIHVGRTRPWKTRIHDRMSCRKSGGVDYKFRSAGLAGRRGVKKTTYISLHLMVIHTSQRLKIPLPGVSSSPWSAMHTRSPSFPGAPDLIDVSFSGHHVPSFAATELGFRLYKKLKISFKRVNN